MKILITSGGTKVPIDRVRHIANMSSGTFGSRIATEFLSQGHKVVFVRAKGSKSPFSKTIDLDNEDFSLKDYTEFVEFYNEHYNNYFEYIYSTYDEYVDVLDKVIFLEQPTHILLAAAVSDYGVENYTDGKVRSSAHMEIKLKPLDKVISKVKLWAPTAKLVGFKLLVDSTEEELIEAAQKSISSNGCDLVVANDLRDIKGNSHKIHLVTKDGVNSYHEHPTVAKVTPQYLPKKVVEATLKL